MSVVEENRAIIPKIVDKIAAEYKPQKIILFGSYAYGEPNEVSDVDILMVTNDPVDWKHLSKMQRRILNDHFVTLQLMNVSIIEYLETKDVIGGIAHPATKYGQVMYENS